MDKTGVLLMAYGTPNSLDEIEPYYTDIRGGHKPTPENLKELVARYQRIGDRAVSPTRDQTGNGLQTGKAARLTPLLEITRAQTQALQTQLGDGFHVYFGMKHWHPYIAEAVEEIVRDGIGRVIALTLAPHYSRFSTEGYFQRVREAIAKLNASLKVTYVESWNDHPLFLHAIDEKLERARQEFGVPTWDGIQVIFSAHSLPERIMQSNDRYPRELQETCEGVAALAGLKQWRFAYQSAGRTSDKWLGPDILATLDDVAAQGARRVLIAPIGFVADHLEILYDIDVECAERARRLGIEMRRIESQNASPPFIAALTSIVREHL